MSYIVGYPDPVRAPVDTRPRLRDVALVVGWIVGMVLICAVIASTAAEARPRHHHHHRHHVRHVRHVVQPSVSQSWFSFGANSIVAQARSQIGNGAIYGRSNLWCARFVNWVLARTGHRGTGSDLAYSFAHYGHRVAGPQVGAIAVMPRRGGGHTGIVSAVTERGDPVIINGNHGGRVAETVYPHERIRAYVVPN